MGAEEKKRRGRPRKLTPDEAADLRDAMRRGGISLALERFRGRLCRASLYNYTRGGQ